MYKTTIQQCLLELVQGDITCQTTDAIVNAANSSLLGGGGVDGAIHQAAGPQLLEATRKLNGCQTGHAKMTSGFQLSARYVIHAVGPIYRQSDENVQKLLASAYRTSLKIATEHQLESLAFPAISAGAYGYPIREAADIALHTSCEFLSDPSSLRTVRFVLFTDEALRVFAGALDQLISLGKCL